MNVITFDLHAACNFILPILDFKVALKLNKNKGK